jgi:hypothetical protein
MQVLNLYAPTLESTKSVGVVGWGIRGVYGGSLTGSLVG